MDPQNQSVDLQKNSVFLPVLLSVLVVFLLSSTAYLGYQNIRLQKDLKDINNKLQLINNGEPHIQIPSVTTTNSNETPPPANGMENWKTYTNSQFGISLKYPNGFTSEKGGSISQHSLFSVSFENPSQAVGFTVEVLQQDVNEIIQNIEDYSAQAAPPVTNIPQSESTIDNLPATKLVIASPLLESQGTTYVMKHGLYSYDLSFTTLPNDYTWIDQVLSTFKFLEPTTIPSTQPTQGKFCGGIAGTSCPDGYACALQGNYPDSSGTCVKNTP